MPRRINAHPSRRRRMQGDCQIWERVARSAVQRGQRNARWRPVPAALQISFAPISFFPFPAMGLFWIRHTEIITKKKRGGVRLLAAARLLLRVRARSPRRYLTACCFTLPGLPFGSVMGSVRSRKPGVHVVHICRRAYSAAAMGCLIMWQWCEEVCKDFFKGWRRGSPPTSRAISQWQAGANRRGRALSPPESNMASHSFKCFSFSSWSQKKKFSWLLHLAQSRMSGCVSGEAVTSLTDVLQGCRLLAFSSL